MSNTKEDCINEGIRPGLGILSEAEQTARRKSALGYDFDSPVEGRMSRPFGYSTVSLEDSEILGAILDMIDVHGESVTTRLNRNRDILSEEAYLTERSVEGVNWDAGYLAALNHVKYIIELKKGRTTKPGLIRSDTWKTYAVVAVVTLTVFATLFVYFK